MEIVLIAPEQELKVLISIVPEAVVYVVIADRGAGAEGYSFTFVRSKGIRVTVEFGDLQRTVEYQAVDGIAQVAEASADTGYQLISDYDTAVLEAAALCSFSDGVPE